MEKVTQKNTDSDSKIPVWIPPVIRFSGAICLVIGVLHIFGSARFFAFLQIYMPVYQPYMTWVGLSLITLGAVKFMSASRPLEFINFLFIFLATKTFMSAKLLINVFNDEISTRLSIALLTLEAVWLPVFAIIIFELMSVRRKQIELTLPTVNRSGLLKNYFDQHGRSLSSLSDEKPLVLIFLRPLNCMFTPAELEQVRSQAADIRAKGFEFVFVHMSPEIAAMNFFKKYNVHHFLRVSDSDYNLYKSCMSGLHPLRKFFCGRFLFSCGRFLFRFGGICPTWGNPLHMNGFCIVSRNIFLKANQSRFIGQRLQLTKAIDECADMIEMPQADTLNEKGNVIYGRFGK